MKILLTVTGYMGSRLLPKLLAEGHEVCCLVRDLSRTATDRFREAHFVCGDPLYPKSLEHAFAGVEVAYYLIHSMGSGKEFTDRDRMATQNFAIVL